MRAYNDAYWSGPELSTKNDRHAPIHLRLLLDVLAANANRVLDVGSGLRHVVAAVCGRGFHATGTDISEVEVAEASRLHAECQLLARDPEDFPWPVETGSVDAVVAFEVIEYLVRPRRLLLGAREELKPNGHLPVATPYHGLLKNLALAIAGFDRHVDVERDHLRFFSDRAVERLLGDSGTAEHMAHFGRVKWLSAGVFVWAKRR